MKTPSPKISSEQLDQEIERRRQMPYTHELRKEADGTWFACIAEFPGCMTTGATQIEALEMLEDAMASWIEAALESGAVIPEPYDKPA